MIETSQYCLDISVGVKGTDKYKENFLLPEDLISFQMYLECGAVVPYIEMAFRVQTTSNQNEDYSMLFKQGSKVTLTIGPDKLHLKTYDLKIGEVNTTQAQTNDAIRVVKFDAVISDKSVQYLTNKGTIEKNGTSIEVIKQLGKQYFNTDLVTDIDAVNETPMVWRQNGMANNMFLTNVWLHTNIQPDVPVMYIDDKLTIHLKSYNKIKNGDVAFTFTPRKPQAGTKDVQFINSFSPQANKLLFNALGSEQQTYITDADTGAVTVVHPNIEKAEIASTKKIEKTRGVGAQKFNRVECANVYRGYKQTYQLNRVRLNYLSGVSGYITLVGLRDDIELLTLVQVKDVSDADNGKYIVFDKRYRVVHGSQFLTYVFLCRDNTNNLERYILEEERKNAFDRFKSEIQNFYTLVRNLRKYVVMARYMIDGSLYRDIIKFATSLKTDLLSSFTVMGIALDFNDTNALFNSMKSIGNGLINNIVKTYLPAPFNQTLQNFALQDPSLKKMVSDLLAYHAPSDLRYLITEINGLLTDITSGLNRVAKDANRQQKASSTSTNYIDNKSTTFKDTPQGVVEVITKENTEMNAEQEVQRRVDNIIQQFIDNTKDLDLPMPIIELTEDQKLLNDIDLEKLLAGFVEADLADKGYLTNIKSAVQADNSNRDVNFTDVLTGTATVGFRTINTVKNNVGITLYDRYYGVFNTPTDLTNFYITDQFHDMYKTVEFQRLVSARKGERIFIALPMREADLKFFINSTSVAMEVMSNIDLGVRTSSGSIVYYNVYMSPKGYNSNSNLVEVRL